MTQPEAWVIALTEWRDKLALPLWSTTGIESNTHSAWEALDHNGGPLPQLDRRQRVQFRQAYAFARSSEPHLQDLAWQLFRRTMDHGFDPNTGHFSTWVHPDLSHLDTNHGLYDLAFSLLAATALGAAGRDVAADLNRIDQAFELLRAPKGWYEDAAHSLPRCQNPHMHMFEASTAAYTMTKASKYLGMAQECLEIVAQSALQKNGQLLEFFTKDWAPLTGVEQSIEPGHMAEWIYLADTFTNVTGLAHGLPLKQMWQAVLEHRLPSGFLPDQAGGQVRRMWPQTELLKAAVVMEKIDPQLTLTARPKDIAQTLWADYMNTPISGGWYDRFEETGALLSTNMPASTYYHIDVAISTCEASSIIRE